MGGVLMRMLLVIGLIAAIGFAIASTSSAQAANASREDIRLLMLDACIESEWRSRSRRASASKRCQCASRKAAKGLKKDQLSTSAWGGGLTWAHSSAWKAALRTCK